MSQTLRKAQRIKDIFPLVNGLFTKMDYTFRTEVSKPILDMQFLANYGKRNPSPVVELVQSEYGEPLTSLELQMLAEAIVQTYGSKWDKLGALYDIEYDPIHNYLDEWSDKTELDETRTEDTDIGDDTTFGKHISDSNTRTDNLTETITFGKSSTRTDNLSEFTTSTAATSGNNTDTGSVWGFNSSTDTNAEKSSSINSSQSSSTDSTQNSGTQTVAETGSDSRRNTGTLSDSGSTTFSGTDSRTIDRDSTLDIDSTKDRSGSHSGNIGNITSQSQIAEEIKLWQWKYVDAILEDVKDFLTVPVYITNLVWVDD